MIDRDSPGLAWDPDEDPERARRLTCPDPEESPRAQELAQMLALALGEIDRLRARADAPRYRASQMNAHERSAWRVLLELGARATEIGGRSALDLRPIRTTSERKLRLLLQASLGVAGRSGCNRRHVDRAGVPVYVVTDDPAPPRPHTPRLPSRPLEAQAAAAVPVTGWFCVKCGVDVLIAADGGCPHCHFHTVVETGRGEDGVDVAK